MYPNEIPWKITSTCFLSFFLLHCFLPRLVGGDDADQGTAQTGNDNFSASSTTVSSAFSKNCTNCDLISEQTVNQLINICPELRPTILKGYYPLWTKNAGDYVPINATDPTDCAAKCCQNSTTCNLAFMTGSECNLLTCADPVGCLPQRVTPTMEKFNLSMILVRLPRSNGGQINNTSIKGSSLVISPNPSIRTNITCEVGIGNACKSNQECVSVNPKSRNGICQCLPGFFLPSNDSATSGCISNQSSVPRNLDDSESTQTTPPIPSTTPPPRTETLTVSVVSKNVTLPTNDVSLFAYAVPEAAANAPYNYKWNLISHPSDDTALMEGQTTQTLHLMGLKAGTYIFSVTVKSGETNGSANATIDVFPERRLNHAPTPVISPVDQTIHLPTRSAVLDASLSTDDDKIISYQWELQKGPVDYFFNPTKANNSTTLQVENLTPGNYTFKLTVEDAEHTRNSTTANITVIKETDYPPTANAGKDTVIYLPQSEVTLNGNASLDDKKITEWEWKATGDLNRAVDMQDTHTPYLKLSHLQVGLYQFELKVTDEAGQSATSTVHVIVKPPTGNPPKANAGQDQTVTLPQTWVLLDASGSSSDSSKITKYTWTQLKGPSNTTITGDPANPKANATGLTKGEYQFQLVVEDDAKHTDQKSLIVNVIQKNNVAPKANAGGDVTVTLPCSVVKLNGSKSSDDVKIAEWKWTRQPDSLAAGVVLHPSEETEILQLTGLIAGRYTFKLTVKDEQGLQDEDFATLIVKEDIHKNDLIEVILDVRVYILTSSDQDKVTQQMTLLLHNVKLVLRGIENQLHTDNAVLTMYGENDQGEVIPGSELVRQLRQRIHQDDGLLQFPIVSIDTVLCSDNCSGHGVCQDLPYGRECLCSAFWMENFLKRQYGSGERNCDWSKVYVGVIACLLVMMVFALIWSLVFIFQKNFGNLKENVKFIGSPTGGRGARESNGKRYHHGSHGQKKQQYTLLGDDAEDEIELEQKDDDEETEIDEESDSDILFETSRSKQSGKKAAKLNGFSHNSSTYQHPSSSSSNGSAVRNGILKTSRRIRV